MRTLIVSDLHIGSHTGIDLLRRPALRAALLERLADVDRLVLLGDVLELRHGPLREAMAASRPFFEDLGRALAGRELVLTAGNHDHALVEPWLAARGGEPDPGPLGLEQIVEPVDASPALAQIAAWAAPARTRVAYPGLWLREDVYAMHGHYLDCHLTVPTLERLTVGGMSRLLGRPASSFAAVEDYEAMGAPVFAWRDAVARDAHTGAALNGMATVAAWRALGGGSSDADAAEVASRRRAMHARLLHGLRRRAMLAGFPLAVAALNRAGLGPLRADISGAELRRAGLAAMGEVADRIGLGAAHVVFGHTHRAGPLSGDEEHEWRGPSGARLHNCGSWVYADIFLASSGPSNPYWPGGAVLVEGSAGGRAPKLERLLAERTRAELVPAPQP